MKTFHCACGQPLFFDNLVCLGCGAEVAYDGRRRHLGALEARADGLWAFRGEARDPAPLFRFCTHRGAAATCNWLVPAADPAAFCLSCSLTRTVPALDRPRNADRLRALEAAKRRVLFQAQTLKLPVVPKTRDEAGLAFDFLESLPEGPPVVTGHAAGVITLNVAEADDDYRDKNRDLLQEHYRTVVGHLRHELGHYYWDMLIRDTSSLESFRALFGDERADYTAALERYYAEGPPPDWRDRFISRYAAAHPWEDWAETWAQYLHINSTLETVTAHKFDISQSPLSITPFGPDALFMPEPAEAGVAFLAWINAMVVLAAVLNETARSMGQPDIYPFVLNRPTVTKLHFVHCVISGDRAARTPPPPEALAPADG